jgi:hypothetical protein
MIRINKNMKIENKTAQRAKRRLNLWVPVLSVKCLLYYIFCAFLARYYSNLCDNWSILSIFNELIGFLSLRLIPFIVSFLKGSVI